MRNFNNNLIINGNLIYRHIEIFYETDIFTLRHHS